MVIESDLGFVEFMLVMMILRIGLGLKCRDAPHDSTNDIEEWRVANVTYSEVRGWDAPDNSIIEME